MFSMCGACIYLAVLYIKPCCLSLHTFTTTLSRANFVKRVCLWLGLVSNSNVFPFMKGGMRSIMVRDGAKAASIKTKVHVLGLDGSGILLWIANTTLGGGVRNE
jgi:hypothetical protein